MSTIPFAFRWHKLLVPIDPNKVARAWKPTGRYSSTLSRSKERVVILGSGWGGYTLSQKLSPKLFSPLIISPRSYFLFTPLLTDAAGNALDFSHVVEPIRHPKTQVDFIQAAAQTVDFQKKVVLCESSVVKHGVTETQPFDEDRGTSTPRPTEVSRPSWDQGNIFEIPYDRLIIAVGTVSRTFNTPGVKENAIFFKDIGDARRVKRRVTECFELAALPNTTREMQEWLLHFAIVGAGPTGTELAASLRDFIHLDLVKVYPKLTVRPRVTLYDVAPTVLSTFDESLGRYAMDTMKKEGITVKTSHHIQNLRWGAPGETPPYHMDPKRCLTLTTQEEGETGVGMCVWATGNAVNPFVREGLHDVQDFPTASVRSQKEDALSPDAARSRWHVKKSPASGALLVDDRFHLQLESDTTKTVALRDVFAIGDNAVLESNPPPATAQATYQEAAWLAHHLNSGDIQSAPPFSFRNLGMLASIGDSHALMQTPQDSSGILGRFLPRQMTGRMAWLIWRSAYLTLSISWRNKSRIAFRWLLNSIFGRDISRY